MRDHKTDEMHTPDIEELMGKSFECPECGRIHSMDTRKLIIGEGLFVDISREIDELGLRGKGLIVCDRNTYKAAGCRLIENLADRDVSLFVFEREDLHADAHSVGRLMIAMADDPAYLIACGSGTITDTVRYVAFLTKKPFIVFATAASVDGFASGSTPLIVDGFKTTYPGKAPLAVLADTEVLAAAPRKMTAAGFGDVLAKIVAVIDWKLARDVGGELFCPLICRMVEKAVDDCISLSGELAKADPQACGKLMRVLSMTGIAMQMMGTTRPASGGEHHISHLLEMKDIRLARRGSLHGDKVGIGTLISLYMYREMFGAHSMPEQKGHLSEKAWTEEIRRVFGDMAQRAMSINDSCPPEGEVWDEQKKIIEKSMSEYGYAYLDKYCGRIGEFASMIRAMGGPVLAGELGYDKQDLYDAIAFSKEVRPKFTILRIAERFGRLYELASEIAADPEIVLR